MRVLMQIGVIVLLAFLGFAGGGMIGAQFVPAGAGLAGGATVFLWAVGGVIVAVAAGAFAVGRLPARTQRILFFTALALAIVMIAWMGSRIAGRSVSLGGPVVFAAERTQRIPFVERHDLPIGLGIAHVAPLPGGVLHFYGTPGIGETPHAYPPSDTVRFGPGQPSVDIAQAPPWPVPDSPILATTTAALPPLAVQGDWLKVSIGHLADRIVPEGWIRWRRGDQLLVAYNPLS